ncbi:MAG: hypothetical protein K0R80_2284 [Clostridia bacterium]|jgi:hypothetical protein|nr:hypothetical protein [Clostridia bacterium]
MKTIRGEKRYLKKPMSWSYCNFDGLKKKVQPLPLKKKLWLTIDFMNLT